MTVIIESANGEEQYETFENVRDIIPVVEFEDYACVHLHQRPAKLVDLTVYRLRVCGSQK